MSLTSTYSTIILILLSTVSSFGQIQKDEDLQYLVDNTFYFDSGILRYEENGKYGFIYQNIRLSEAIYDTIYNFGQAICIVKRNGEFFILDRNLKNTYGVPIGSIEKYYSDEKNKYVLIVISKDRGYYSEYYTSKETNWGFECGNNFHFNPIQLNRSVFERSIIDSIVQSTKSAEDKDLIHNLHFSDIKAEIKYDRVTYDADLVKFCPKNGTPFIRNRKGLRLMSYLGGSLFEYKNDKYKIIIMDEESLDTILVTNSLRVDAFSVDGKLYLYEEIYSSNESTRFKIYNEKGVLLHMYSPAKVDGELNSVNFYRGMLMEVVGQFSKKGTTEIYTIYNPVNMECILKRVLLTSCSQTKNFQLFFAPDTRTYSVLKGTKIIYSFVVKKGIVAGFQIVEAGEFENEPISIYLFNKKNQLLESIIISSTGKELTRSKEVGFRLRLSLDKKIIEIHKTDSRFAIYSPEKDSLLWFDPTDGFVGMLTSNILHFRDSTGDHYETINEKVVLDIRKRTLVPIQSTSGKVFYEVISRMNGDLYETINGEVVQDIEKRRLIPVQSKNGHTYYEVISEVNNSVYNSDFQFVCDSCSIYVVNQSNFQIKFTPSLFALQDKTSNLFQLLNEDFEPLGNGPYRAILDTNRFDGRKMVAVLTEAGEIEYLMVD